MLKLDSRKLEQCREQGHCVHAIDATTPPSMNTHALHHARRPLTAAPAMVRLALFFALLGCLALAFASRSYEGYRVLRIFPTTDAQVEWVRDLHKDGSLDFWSGSDVMVGPDREESLAHQLTDMGVAWETIIPDVQVTIDAERFRQLVAAPDGASRAISFTKYNRYDEIVSYLTQLQKDFPDLVTVGSIGTSTEGRSLPVIKISSGGNGKRPLILIDAGIHAREWIAPAMALYIIQQLVENPSNADLLANADWHIIPTLNPDGYEYSHTKERFWRKTRSSHRCALSSDPKQGVDGNRNFDFHWMEVGASSSACSETFAGPSSFSEPETRGLRDYVLANAARTKLYISFHSYGNYFLYPWGYTSALPSNNKELNDLARAANAAQVAAGGKSYTIGTSTNVLYAAAGGSDDWVKGVGGVDLSYTIELPGGGSGGFDLPASAIARTVSTFFPAIRVMGEHINNNL